MSEQKKVINFIVACVNEFAWKYHISAKEAFQYLFQFKAIEFLKENYEAERMAIRVSKIYGGDPVLNVFELNDDFKTRTDLRIKDFGEQTSEEWA